MSKTYKILLGFTDIAGYLSNLQIGFKENGVHAGLINVYNKYGYNINENINPKILNIFNKQCYIYLCSNKNIIDKFKIYFFSIIVFFYIMLNFNTIIMCAGFSLFNLVEIRILKFIGFKIINVSLGSDTRAPYLNGIYKNNKDEEIDINNLINETKKIKYNIINIEKLVDYFISYPQICHLNEKNIINGNYIGFPINYIDIQKNNKINIKKKEELNTIRILHAPSRPNVKGTKIIRQIVDNLKKEGHKIELIEAINVPNEVVLKLISECDIIFDEIYSDVPLGGLGAEAAIQSKPVLVGGYYARCVREHTPSEMIPPSIFVEPDQLVDSLRNLIINKKLRESIGIELHKFVRDKWNPKVVSKRYLQLLQNSFSNEWFYNPIYSNYFHGYGLNENDVKIIIKEMTLNYKEVKNLMLKDKKMQNKIVLFAKK